MIRRIVILSTLGLALMGCTLLPPTFPTPVRPPEVESTADALRLAVEGDYPLDALTIRYQIGSRAWGGRTEVVAEGDGPVRVSFDLAEQQDSWTSSLTENEFMALLRLLVDHELWAIKGQREMGVPDEVYPAVTVEAEGLEPLSVGMWHGEALEHSDFQAIMSVLAGLASNISGGVAK